VTQDNQAYDEKTDKLTGGRWKPWRARKMLVPAS
jgi:hypothetical protein